MNNDRWLAILLYAGALFLAYFAERRVRPCYAIWMHDASIAINSRLFWWKALLLLGLPPLRLLWRPVRVKVLAAAYGLRGAFLLLSLLLARSCITNGEIGYRYIGAGVALFYYLLQFSSFALLVFLLFSKPPVRS